MFFEPEINVEIFVRFLLLREIIFTSCSSWISSEYDRDTDLCVSTWIRKEEGNPLREYLEE